MPVLKVKLNKLSSDWQVARAILEDEFTSLDKASSKFRTRYEFAAHLLDVHRHWCVRRALSRPACVPLRSDGGTADGAQSKMYVSTSTQTESSTGATNPFSDQLIKQEVVSHENRDVDMERSVTESTSEQRHGEESSTKHIGSDVKSLLEKGNLNLLVKQESVSHENRDEDSESSKNESTSHQRHGEEISTQNNGSVAESLLERGNPDSDFLVEQEAVSHENRGVDVDSSKNESTSRQRHGEESSTQHIGSDIHSLLERTDSCSDVLIQQALEELWDVDMEDYSKNESISEQIHQEEISTIRNRLESDDGGTDPRSALLVKEGVVPHEKCDVDVENTNRESTSEQRHDKEIPTLHIGPDGDINGENISGPSSSTFDESSPEGLSPDVYDADEMTILEDNSKTSRSPNDNDGQSPESNSKTSRSPNDNDGHSPEDTSLDLCDAGISRKRKKPNQCFVCKKHFIKKYNLTVHMRTHTGEKPFQCNSCSYKCSHMHSLTRHMRIHTGEKPFQCNSCSYKCSHMHSLTRHMRTHTREKPFQCNSCSFRCSNMHSLTSHMRTHAGEKPFQCDSCGYRCSHMHILTRHMRTHTGEKPFQCDSCGYRCSHMHSLTSHMRIHTGEKPYKCSVCNKAFTQHGEVTRHMRIHTGEKPFKCNNCSFKCSQKNTLTRHMRTHTGEKPYQCSVCNKAFTRRSYVTNHMRTHIDEGKPFH